MGKKLKAADDVLTMENACQVSERFINTVSAYPGGFEGRGIVIAAGGLRFFSNAWVCINMLRRAGCQLPIQLWCLGDDEIDDYMRSLVVPLGVDCVNIFDAQEDHPAKIAGGWQLKPYAILWSRFKEVLLLDADNVPIVNPEFLFDSHQFQETGVIFWPDAEHFGPNHKIWNICGVPYQDEPTVESGQIMFDKERCWRALCLTLWYNEHSHFYYRHIYGDKDTFHMAFRKLNQPYSMPATPYHPLTETMCQHDFEGNRIFQHRWSADWNVLEENKRIDGFHFEDECRNYLDQLRQYLEGNWARWRFRLLSKPEALRMIALELIGRLFEFRGIGGTPRLMTFLANGAVGLGRTTCEMLWDLEEKNHEIRLIISSEWYKMWSLKRSDGKTWQGRPGHGKSPLVQLLAKDAPFDPDSKSERVRDAAKRVTSRVFDYYRVSHDRRRITFLKNGLIGVGQNAAEALWDIEEDNRDLVLNIRSEAGLTCRLVEEVDNIWRGCWTHHKGIPRVWIGHRVYSDRILVELTPTMTNKMPKNLGP
jgi:hypothetical protein